LGVYRALAEREVDLVLHLGDYIYEDAGLHGHRRHQPPHEAVTIDDYRRRLAQLRADPDTQSLHLRHPMTTVWDDHDFCDNAWRDGKRHDPSRDGPGRIESGRRQARQEWLPVRRTTPTSRWRRGGPWRSASWQNWSCSLIVAGDDGARLR
jgi:phosphodiesterase/alkaline phosphatase D-like protein